MKEISAGDLRTRIVFEQATKADDGHGGHTTTWSAFVTVWASVEPLSGREYFFAHQIQSEVTHRVRVRYRNDIDAKMRIKIESRILGIESIIDLGEKHCFLEILCKETK